MKTAISIPDSVFNQAESLAQRLGVSRSKLYARALDAFLASHAPANLTEAMDAAIEAVGAGKDPFVKAGARRVFDRTEW